MKKVNIVLFGVSNIGSTLINQILAAREQFKFKKNHRNENAPH